MYWQKLRRLTVRGTVYTLAVMEEVERCSLWHYNSQARLPRQRRCSLVWPRIVCARPGLHLCEIEANEQHSQNPDIS